MIEYFTLVVLKFSMYCIKSMSCHVLCFIVCDVMSCLPIGTTFDHNYSGMSCKIQGSVFMALELYMGLGSKILQSSVLYTTCNTCWNGYFFLLFFFFFLFYL